MFSLFSALGLNSLSFTSLAAFSLLAALPLLVLAYLKQTPSKQKIVSSTIVLKALVKRVAIKKKLKLPLRFFLELAALLFIILALSSPTWNQGSNTIAIVVDNSLSMRARISGASDQTRFDEAIEEIDHWLRLQTSTSRYQIFTTSPKLLALENKLLPHSAVKDSITKIKPTFSNDNLETEIHFLAKENNFDAIFIVTDRELSLIEDRTTVAESEGKFSQVISHKVGASTPNFFINSLKVEQTRLLNESAKLVASVSLSSNEPREVTARLYKGRNLEEEVSTITKTVSPQKPTEFNFELLESLKKNARYRVELINLAKTSDAIAEDNSAWFLLSQSLGTEITIISDDRSLTNYALDLIPGLQVRQLTPEEFGNSSSKVLTESALLIFHKCAPSSILSKPTLIILPPSGNPYAEALASQKQTEAKNLIITSWAEEHQITSYLRVPLLELTNAISYSPPNTAQSVLNIASGSIYLAGEISAKRYVVSGIELLPFEGNKTPVVSILTLNTIKWLLGGSELSTNYITGGSTELTPNVTWVINTPQENDAQTIELGTAESKTLDFKTPGIYSLTKISSGVDNSVEKKSAFIAVNVTHPIESETMKVHPLNIQRHLPRKNDISSRLNLWPFLALLALIILSIDPLIRIAQKK